MVLLDWMTALQPLGAPPWTISETATRRPRPVRREPSVAAISTSRVRPRSASVWLAMLEAAAPDRRDAAVLALSEWPEPEVAVHVMRAFLRGRVTVPVQACPARTLSAIGETELRTGEILPHRVIRTALRLEDPADLLPLVPLLLQWWEHGLPAVRPEAGQALHRVPADALAEILGDRIDAGARGLLDLLSGRPLLRTPALERACRRLRAEGRDDLADGLRLVDGPLRGPDAGRRDTAASDALRERARVRRPALPALRPGRNCWPWPGPAIPSRYAGLSPAWPRSTGDRARTRSRTRTWRP